jgi:pilus assembly protein Flp/PilA
MNATYGLCRSPICAPPQCFSPAQFFLFNTVPSMISSIYRFLADESGPTAVEYGVLLALIVVVCVGSVNAMSQATADSFDESAGQLSSILGS